MKLIIILIALGLERFTHIGSFAQRFNWFSKYLALCNKVFQKANLWQGSIGVVLAVLPLLIVVAIVYYSVCGFFHGLFGVVLAAIILIYCLGPKDLYSNLENYFVAKVQDNKESAQKALDNILVEKPEDETLLSRAVTKSIFIQYNARLFAVCFWFVILGPLGAVLYRVVSELTKASAEKDSPEGSMQQTSTLVQSILDWIPVRLMSLGFALMGDFMHGFGYWLKNATSGFDKNNEIAEKSGLIAMGLNDKSAAKADVNENKNALALVDRNSIVFLVVVALFVLGAWIY